MVFETSPRSRSTAGWTMPFSDSEAQSARAVHLRAGGFGAHSGQGARTAADRRPHSGQPVARAGSGALGCPMITTSVKDDDRVVEYTTDPELIHERYGREVALVIDGGIGDNVPRRSWT